MRRNLPIIRTAKLSLLLIGAIATAPALVAQSNSVDMQQIEQDLAGKFTILLSNGTRQSGQIVSWDGDSIRLKVELGGGSAEMQFAADEIKDVAFPGNEYLELLNTLVSDPDRSKDALDLFRAFYKQRGPYLQYMDENEMGLLVRYARYALEKDKPLTAVAVINVLRPHIENETLLKSLDDAILLGFFLGGMKEEAEAQAREWIVSADPAGPSALGWRILAEIYFTKEEYETSFWTALYPVAYANQMPMEHLNACYAFAIAAAGKNRQTEVMVRLHREMRDRALPWPENIPVLVGLEPELLPPTEVAEVDTPAIDETDTVKATGEATEPAPETPIPGPSSSLPSRLPQTSQ